MNYLITTAILIISASIFTVGYLLGEGVTEAKHNNQN